MVALFLGMVGLDVKTWDSKPESMHQLDGSSMAEDTSLCRLLSKGNKKFEAGHCSSAKANEEADKWVLRNRLLRPVDREKQQCPLL